MIFHQNYRFTGSVCFSILILISGSSACGVEGIGPRIHASHFLLKQKDTEQCLVVLDELEGCSSDENGPSESCSDSGDTNRVVLDHCNEGLPAQRWVFDFQDRRIHSLERRTELCLTRLSDRLSMASCQDTSLNQLWFFNQQNVLFCRADVSDPLAFKTGLQNESENTSPVIFQFVDAETGDDHCYLSPFTGRVDCPGFEHDAASLQKQVMERWHWSGRWPWQSEPGKLTEDLQLGDRRNNRCLAIEQCHVDSVGQYDCFGNANVKFQACRPESYQNWRYDLVSRRLFNQQAGEHFCLSWQSGRLSLAHCLPGKAVSQKWYFARGNGRQYPERGRLRWFANQREHYDYIKFLGFDSIVKFEILKNDNHGEGCGYDPVDGLWKGQCAN